MILFYSQCSLPLFYDKLIYALYWRKLTLLWTRTKLPAENVFQISLKRWRSWGRWYLVVDKPAAVERRRKTNKGKLACPAWKWIQTLSNSRLRYEYLRTIIFKNRQHKPISVNPVCRKLYQACACLSVSTEVWEFAPIAKPTLKPRHIADPNWQKKRLTHYEVLAHEFSKTGAQSLERSATLLNLTTANVAASP